MVQKQFLITLVHLKMTLNRETINLVPALLSLPASGVHFIVSVHRQLSAEQMLAKMVVRGIRLPNANVHYTTACTVQLFQRMLYPCPMINDASMF